MMDIKDTPICSGAEIQMPETTKQHTKYDMNRLVDLFNERIQGFLDLEWEIERVGFFGWPDKYAFWHSPHSVISFGIDKDDQFGVTVYALGKGRVKVPYEWTFGYLETMCLGIIDTFNKCLTNTILYGAKAETKIVDEYVDFLNLQEQHDEVDDGE